MIVQKKVTEQNYHFDYQNKKYSETIINTSVQNTKVAFNNIAQKYDLCDNQNPILKWMRGLVHKTALRYIPKNSSILELNAGTGVDAVFFADHGMTVHATDISDEMIKMIVQKIGTENLKNKISSEVLSFNEISKVSGGPFDAVFSNFGGLNCINDFSKLSADLYSKLKPGGLFIAVVMNKFCPWEIFYYLLRLDPKNAFRRLGNNGIMAELNGEKVKTFYFSPGGFTKQFKPKFEILKIKTLAYYTPPPYLEGIYRRFKPIVKLFMFMDEIVMGIFPFNRLGDHFIIIMKRNGQLAND